MSETFWKATRPDGTDFYSGRIDYAAAVGSAISPELAVNGGSFPGPGWLHLATVPTACVGMTWPARLFEVEPVGDVLRAVSHPHKVGCHQVRVLREVPAHVALGPQGELVAAVIDRAGRLTRDEAKRLDAAWAAARDAARDAAKDAAKDAARDAAKDAAWYAARDAAWYAAKDAAKDAAWDAAGYAAGALVVRDLISHDHWQTLAGPWESVVGPVDDLLPVDGAS